MVQRHTDLPRFKISMLPSRAFALQKAREVKMHGASCTGREEQVQSCLGGFLCSCIILLIAMLSQRSDAYGNMCRRVQLV